MQIRKCAHGGYLKTYDDELLDHPLNINIHNAILH